MKNLFILLLSIISLSVFAQTYNMSNTTISTCSGTVYDPGGTGNYANSQDFTLTICPSTPGAKVQINFTTFVTENSYDFLYIYDGNSTAATTLGAYTGTSGPGMVSATGANASGCITLRWHSDISNVFAGFVGAISCSTPCQTINSVFNSSSPAPVGGIIKVCQGQSVTFNGSATFSGSSAGATYSWNFDNGQTGSGTTASTTYTAPGVYVVNLTTTAGGCVNQNKINQIVQVSTTPSFTATTTNTTSICLGQTATLIGSVTPTPFVTNCTPPVAGTTFLPDGSGLSYSTAITVDCYGSTQTVTSAADINNICLNMEHSYQGDLSIQIICPNGQVCNLKDYPGGAYNYLGAPLDDPTVGPGVGAYYCFAMSGTVLLCNGPTVAGQGTPAYTSIAAGTYSPTGNFSSLVGCPLNGNWTIKVTDNLGSDNGYIFNWDINFNAAVPASQSFTPTIVSQTWSGPNIISTSGNNATIQPTTTGSHCYTLTAVDNFGCSYTTVRCITVNPGPYAGVSNTLAVCSSAASTNLFGLLGTVVSTTGTWSGPAPALTGGNLGTFNPASYAAGTYNYTYTVPASGGCPATSAVISVTIRPMPAATLSFTNPSCGNNNGIIVINNTSSGGQTISTFASSLGAISGQTVTGLGAGTPVITLTNNFGCTFTVSATLIMSPGPTAIATSTTNATCGLNNGTYTFGAPTGGTGPYTYAIGAGPFTATSPVTGQAPGTYSITVKDVNGCTFGQNVTISNIPGPTAIAGTTTQASCNTNNGTYNVTGVTGGTAAYTYSVDGVATAALTSGLAAGAHTILVKDANGCTFSTTFNIGTANGPSTFVVNTTNASCGTANGTSTVTGVVGGTPTYSFSFDGGAFGTATTTSALTGGSHNVTIKDANSCTLTVTYNVATNAAPAASVTSSLNVLCNGAATGSLTVAPTGGTGPFTYTLTTPIQTNTTGAFTGLVAGTYNMTVKDASGCTATVSAVISQPTAVTGTVSMIPVNCFGNSTGTVTAGGAGGVGPYTYLWPALGNSTSATTGGAAAGTYTVTIRDANNCAITRTVTVTQPTPLTLTSILTPATCGNANGSGTVTVSGGTTAYGYNWSNGGSTNVLTAAAAGVHTLTTTDANGCILTSTVTITNIPGPTAITGTTTLAGCNLNNGTYNVTGVTGGTAAYTYSVDGVGTASLTSGLAAGAHTILVKDANGCTFSTTFNINTANGPTTATVVTTNASCGTANGTSTVTGVTGGTPAYQYSFDGGPFGATATTSGLAAGTHTVIIRDVNTCTLAVTYTELNNSGPSASVTSSLNVLCNGASTGSVTVVPSGGIAPFTYTLTAPTLTNTTGNFTGLPAGTYNMIVKDNSGCTATASVTLTQPTALTLTVTSMPANCFGSATGTVSASGSGGVASYTYLWPALGSNTNATVTNATAGTYSVTQTDANGCSITQGITVTQPTALALTSTLTPATCGNANGSGTVTVTGGTPVYTYNWSTGSITSILSGAAAGVHTLTTTDFKGCTLTSTVNITNIPGPTAITGTTTLSGCGIANGSYNVTGVTGGTATFSFMVDGVATTSLTSGLAAGIHTVQVTDANSCTFNTTFNIGTAAGPVTATVVTANATCGSANGSATVTGVTGGSGPYQYSFDGSTFAAGTTTTGLIAGTHTLAVKDANLCVLTINFNVLNNGTPTSSIVSTTNTSCFGGTNGGFTIAGAGGSGGPFTYTVTAPFQTNVATGVFTGLPAGTYTVNVNDVVGCLTTNTVTISQPTQISLTVTSVPALCAGAATGTVNITGGGGTPAYSYILNGGSPQTASSYTAVGAGSYIITIKDANNCATTQTVQVTEPPVLTIQVATQNANCTAANGIITTTVSGGTPIYTYTWSAGGAGPNLNGVVAGTYTVLATDFNGCTVTAQPVVALTPGGTATIAAVSNITCNGANDGQLTISPIGGAGPFTFSWTPGGQTVANAINLSPGTYTGTVTDFYGCKATAIGTITQPPVLTAIMNSNNVKCFNTPTGTVTAAGTGGTGPYTYLWPNIPSNLQTVAGVIAGTYTCHITDDNGCTITQTIAVTEPTAISLTSTVTPANCGQPNGSATVTASGGAPLAYTYSWSPGSTTTVQGGISAGTYTIIVTDANLCPETLAVTIPNLSGPAISISSQTNVSCFGACDGVVTTSVTGGQTPYIYSWSNGIVNPIGTNLCAQLYTVSVTDGAGCVASMSVNITEPTALTVNILPTDPKCFGSSDGSGIAVAQGGTGSYTYTWTSTAGNNSTTNPIPQGTYGITVEDDNGCVVTSSMTLVNPLAMTASITSTNVSCFGVCDGIATATTTNNSGIVSYYWTGGSFPIPTQTAANLCAGTYTMTGTDQNGCVAVAQITITEPAVLTASISSTGSVTCNAGNNGFISVSATGGTAPYTYVWTGVASGSGTNANNLPAGTYSVTVTDNHGCSVTTNATVIQPAPLTTTLVTADPLCNGVCDGTAILGTSGGIGIPTFLWQPGLQGGNSVNTLCAGNQSVTVTYNGTCSTVLTFTLGQPAVLTAAVSATNSNCGQSNGGVCATVAGGTGILSYQWNGTSGAATTVCYNNIAAGAYNFIVTDANGCTANASGLVNDIAGPVVAITSQTNVTCFGAFNGGATATIVGGVPGPGNTYTISWSGTQAAANTTTITSNFGFGLHNIIVQDVAGCVGTASVNILQPASFVSAIGSTTDVTCFGASDGGATILVNGGTGPYTYLWTPSAQTNSVLANVTANTYTGNVIDANGCIASATTTIIQPQALVLTTSSVTNVSCFGGSNGQISTTVNGGTPGYTFSWTPGTIGTTANPVGLPMGPVTGTVTDQHGCFINLNFNISEPSVLTSNATSSPATCGLSNGSATLVVGGGTPNYTVLWNTAPPYSGLTPSNMAPGTWTANISDSKGCLLTQTVTVTNPPVPAISGFSVNAPSCFGLCNGDITINYTAGTAPYTVSWSNPISQTNTSAALTQNVAGICAGVYTATLTDNYGCATSAPVNVNQPGLLVLQINPNPTVTICYGQSTQIAASGQNGTGPYTYTWTPTPFVGGGPHTVNPVNTSTYGVVVQDSKGCTASPKVITVNVTPPLTFASNQINLCDSLNGSLTPTITSAGNGGPYTYAWTPTNSSTSAITVMGHAAGSTSTTVTYSLIISDGCTMPPAAGVFTVVTNPRPTVNIIASSTVQCAPGVISFTAVPGTSGGYSYSWINDGKDIMGTSNPITHTYPDADTLGVGVTITDTITGCSRTIQKNNFIVINKQPVAAFYPDPATTSILDPNINFINTSQGGVNYFWDFGDQNASGTNPNNSSVFGPSHYYNAVGVYHVHLLVTSINGCQDIAEGLVEILPDFALYIPNSFTPDANGLNDVFQPMGVGIDEENYRMDIYDRWGENIFTSNAFRKGWDGTVKGGSKVAEQGVYTYKVLVKDSQGNNHPYVGHVTLIKKEN
ncbi:MAG: PKD domain-containing protein [Bacteroidota bacterium]